MSLQVKFPFGRGQGPLHTCRSCGFGTRHRVLFERHTKRCPAEIQRTQQLQQQQAQSSRQQMGPPPLQPLSAAGKPALPLPPVCRNYKCEKCTFTTNKSRIFLFHQREVHGENITIYVCDHCEYASRHKNKVYRHRKLVHKDADPLDEIPSESDAALQRYVLNQDKPVDVQHNEPAEVTEEELMRESYTNINGSPSMVNPRPTPVDDRYATYDYGDSDISMGHTSMNLDSSAYETVDEEILDDNGDPINQNPDPTENAYDYIIKSADYSIESPSFKCKLCYYSNPHKWKIANHIRTIHMKKTLFKCPYCDFVCERKIEWCVHKTSHTNKVVYSCQECQYRTTMKRNFDRHQARHRSCGPIKCSMCSYSSTGEAAIQRHMAEYHPSPPKDESKLPSPSPAKSWTAGASASPVKLPPRYCRTPDQPERINSFSPVSTPSTTPRPSTQPSPMSSTCSSPSDVICPVCGLNVKTESKLKIHMVSHSSEAHWTCPMCPLRYKRAADLNRHMKRKHAIRLCDYRNGAMPTAPIQDQPLDLCVKKLSSSDEGDDVDDDVIINLDQPLDLSMKTSPPSSPPVRPVVYKPENLKCSHCSYLAKWPSDLRRHMLVHSIEKRFRCQYCNKKYKYQFDLNMHLRKTHKIPAGRTRIGTVYLASNAPPKPAVHPENEEESPDDYQQSETAAVKPQPPPVKPAAAAATKAEDKARNEDSLKCKFCKYVGKYRAEVERHMRLHTGKKPYHCMFCVYKSFWKGDMKRHLQKHHPEDIDQSGRDIKALVNDTFRPSDDEPTDETPENTSTQGDLMDLASLIEPEEDDKQPETFAEAFPTYPGFGETVFPGMETPVFPGMEQRQVVFPGMEPNNNTSSDQKSNYDEECSPSPVPWAGAETNNNTPDKQSNVISDPKKVCKCPRCPFVCEAPSKLKCHMEIHDNLKRFMCPLCGKRSNWLWDVRKHIRKDHPGAPMDVTEMSEENARNTLGDYLSKQKSPSKASSKERSLSPSPGKPHSDITEGEGSILNQMLTMRGQFIKQEPRDDEEEEMMMETDFPQPISLPFSRMSQEKEDERETPVHKPPNRKHVAVGRYRPFKCSKCGRRSNWRWDLNKHIRQAHGSAKIITLTDEEAKATFHECLQGGSTQYYTKHSKPVVATTAAAAIKVKAQPPPPPSGRYRPFKCSKCNRRSNWKWDMNKHIRQVHPDATLIELSEEEARATYYEVEHPSEPLTSPKGEDKIPDKMSPASKNNLTQDVHKLKRFKCSGCPYRSNFRSDIGRHIKRKHRKASVHVEVLDMDEAAATLAEYKEVWARKKFVPSPAKLSPRKAASLRAMKPEISYTTATPVTTSSHISHPIGSNPKILSNIGRIPSNSLSRPGASSLRAKVWRCTKCNFKDRNKKVVVKHFRSHSDGTAFMCRVCGECADYRSTLVRHVRTKHHREDLVNCILETAIEDTSIPVDEIPAYSHGANLMEVEKEEEEMSPSVGYILKHYNCRLCDFNSGDKDEVVGHVQDAHPEEEEPADAVEEVDKITPVPPEETYANSPRKAKADNSQKSLLCKHCPYRTNKQGLLKIHLTYHKPQPGNKYKCKYCPYYVCASRLLHQHQALHEKEHKDQGISFQEAYPGQLDEGPTIVDCVPRLAFRGTTSSPRTTARGRHFCDKCPYVSINKNDFIYHKQFHRPRPSAIHKCDHCPYWVKLRRLLTQHMKVHTTQYKIQFYPPQMLKDLNLQVDVTHNRRESEVSSDDEDDAVAVADLKQQIITSKITSVPITPEKLRPDSPSVSSPWEKSDPVLVVNKSGQILTGGTYKRHHKCPHCPFVNVRAANLKHHEKMHSVNGGKGNFKCSFCDYRVSTKILLSNHLKVHSRQYRPGEDDIHDVEAEPHKVVQVKDEESMEDDEEGDEKKEETTKPKFAFPERPTVPSDPAQRVDAAKLPQNMEYYVTFDEHTGEHILEKATLKKWCCEKCPYATMKRTQFEKHDKLHGSNQKYSCEFCDYSVPGYHLLLQHKQLHLMPNPNLLSVQSISNLQKLPEVPADVAAASNYPNTTTESPSKSSTTTKHGIHDHMEMYENSTDFSEPKKLYRCDRCPYTNNRRDHLLSHLKFHVIHSDNKCPYCDYSVQQMHLLNQHIKVHFNTPGGEMNALPAAGKKDKSDKSPSAAAGSPPAEAKPRQPEFIDIADLEKTMKDGDEVDDKKDEKKTGEKRKAVDESSGSDTETYEPTEEPQPKAGSSDEHAADKENSGVVAKKRKTADKEAVVEKEKKSETRPSPALLVCQYCDRSFNVSDKLKRHERQHLVGSKF